MAGNPPPLGGNKQETQGPPFPPHHSLPSGLDGEGPFRVSEMARAGSGVGFRTQTRGHQGVLKEPVGPCLGAPGALPGCPWVPAAADRSHLVKALPIPPSCIALTAQSEGVSELGVWCLHVWCVVGLCV